MGTEDAWRRLGAAVTARRIALNYATQVAFAAASGLGPRLVNEIENGRRGSYHPATIAALETTLRWETGGVARILDGEQPVEVAAPDPEPAPNGPLLTEASDWELAMETYRRMAAKAVEAGRRATREEKAAAWIPHPALRAPTEVDDTPSTTEAGDTPPLAESP